MRRHEKGASERWKLLAQRIGEMPHMRPRIGTPTETVDARKPTTIGRGLHAVPSRRAATLAIALIVAFAAGYLAARWQG